MKSWFVILTSNTLKSLSSLYQRMRFAFNLFVGHGGELNDFGTAGTMMKVEGSPKATEDSNP
jgi:hypothetical protein